MTTDGLTNNNPRTRWTVVAIIALVLAATMDIVVVYLLAQQEAISAAVITGVFGVATAALTIAGKSLDERILVTLSLTMLALSLLPAGYIYYTDTKPLVATFTYSDNVNVLTLTPQTSATIQASATQDRSWVKIGMTLVDVNPDSSNCVPGSTLVLSWNEHGHSGDLSLISAQSKDINLPIASSSIMITITLHNPDNYCELKVTNVDAVFHD
jgi:hypothetical protein